MSFKRIKHNNHSYDKNIKKIAYRYTPLQESFETLLQKQDIKIDKLEKFLFLSVLFNFIFCLVYGVNFIVNLF